MPSVTYSRKNAARRPRRVASRLGSMHYRKACGWASRYHGQVQLKDLDLNLLRLFDAVYRTRNVSRAAELLDLTQPAASQGLTRLRALLHDPLFMRASGGVQPTPKAQRLAGPVRHALATLEQALGESAGFDPATSQRTFNIHMSDIGEGRFLPELMAALRERAPGARADAPVAARADHR